MIDAASQKTWFGHFVGTRLHLLFLLYALPCVIVLSVIMGPFQVADELAHMQRSDQISRGKLVSDRLGGTIDGSWVTIGALYQNMWFHPEVKQTVALAREAGAIRWSGPRDHVNFQNTAQYGPMLYAPQVIGIGLGRLMDLSLARTLVLARWLNGLAACLVGFFALRICRRGRALAFATLLLPMTLSQFASASADALLISLSILGVSIVSRVLTEQRPASVPEFAAFVIIVTATTMTRPPQFAFALLLPLLVSWRDAERATKTVIGVAALAAVIVWLRILADLTPPVPSNLSLSGQAHLLLTRPLTLPTVILKSIASQGSWLPKTVVGGLGWVDTFMPNWYYVAAAAVLGLALVAPGNRGPWLWAALLAVLTFGALFAALCIALYVTWTPLGQSTINGLQGRYILPALPLLAWPVPEYRPRLARVLELVWYPVLLFPLVTLGVTPAVIMARYYGSWTVMADSLNALLLP